jgi:hypothetical protein
MQTHVERGVTTRQLSLNEVVARFKGTRVPLPLAAWGIADKLVLGSAPLVISTCSFQREEPTKLF